MSVAREAQVVAAVNEIADPCSCGVGVPTGIADLGLLERVELDGGSVRVVLTTTSPSCMFVGHFEEEIERRVGSLPWVDSVEVELDYGVMWDESRMSERARAELHARHRAPRGRLLEVLS
jgi:metal-sulfur cluster biosynthetic enzyme